MSERDPKFDPMPGDVLIIGPQWQSERYEIVGADGRLVQYRFGPERPVLSCNLREWREWARGGEVIHRAEDAATGRKE